MVAVVVVVVAVVVISGGSGSSSSSSTGPSAEDGGIQIARAYFCFNQSPSRIDLLECLRLLPQHGKNLDGCSLARVI